MSKDKKPCPPCQLAINNEKKKAEEAEEKYLRLAAEFENYKKRQEKEMSKFKKTTVKEIMKDILPVMDSLEELMMMFYSDNLTIKMLSEGVDATISLLSDFLEANNVKTFNSLGEGFDPNIHKSIGSRLITKYPKDTIVEVFRKGYMIDDILLRAADVMISKKSEKEK